MSTKETQPSTSAGQCRLLLMVTCLGIAGAAPSVLAATIAYEGFDYADVGADLLGKSGGVGFTGEWRGSETSHTNYDIAEGTLRFLDLGTQGNRVSTPALFNVFGGMKREFSESISRDETITRYLSFLLRPEGTVGEGLFEGFFTAGIGGFGIGVAPDVRDGSGSNVPPVYLMTQPGGVGAHFSEVPVVADETALLVVKAELAPGDRNRGIDTFTMYVNPVPGLPEPQTGVVKNDLNIGDVTHVSFGGTGAFSIDEIRWGETFADVTPIPEPSTAVLSLLGLTCLLGWRRKKPSEAR